jgi:hypothetical protein
MSTIQLLHRRRFWAASLASTIVPFLIAWLAIWRTPQYLEWKAWNDTLPTFSQEEYNLKKMKSDKFFDEMGQFKILQPSQSFGILNSKALSDHLETFMKENPTVDPEIMLYAYKFTIALHFLIQGENETGGKSALPALLKYDFGTVSSNAFLTPFEEIASAAAKGRLSPEILNQFDPIIKSAKLRGLQDYAMNYHRDSGIISATESCAESLNKALFFLGKAAGAPVDSTLKSPILYWTAPRFYFGKLNQVVQSVDSSSLPWRRPNGISHEDLPLTERAIRLFLSIQGNWAEFGYISADYDIYRIQASFKSISLLASSLVQEKAKTGTYPGSLKELAQKYQIPTPDAHTKPPPLVSQKYGDKTWEKPIGEITWAKVPTTRDVAANFVGLNIDQNSAFQSTKPVPLDSTSGTVKYVLPVQGINNAQLLYLMAYSLKKSFPGIVTSCTVLTVGTPTLPSNTATSLAPGLDSTDTAISISSDYLTTKAKEILKEHPPQSATDMLVEVTLPDHMWELSLVNNSGFLQSLKRRVVFLPADYHPPKSGN